MAGGRMRSTRRLRSWIVDQVSSGKYPGLVWDDDAKTMFRIPWKHAGKQDFRKDEDAAIFKAWAEFKGKLTDGGQDNPASWKTRLRCALNKSPEFMEVMDRAQLDISEPYKVYRLVPINEQGMVVPEKKCREKAAKRPKKRRRRSSSSESESESDDVSPGKQIKTEEVTSQLSDKNLYDAQAAIEQALRHIDIVSPGKQIKTEEVTSQLSDKNLYDAQAAIEEALRHIDVPAPKEEPTLFSTSSSSSSITVPRDVVDEITLDVRIEESVAAATEAQDSFRVLVQYLGQEVLSRQIQGSDVRITYLPSSLAPPTSAVLRGRFPRIPLPEPPSTLPASPELQALFTLLPFMERGVVLTSTPQGVYGKRFCQGRVFWTGPHTTEPGLHKMERNTEPVLLFSKDVFKQQLDFYRSNGGEPPQCSITMCFGEELSRTDDPSGKLIIVQITLPWAEEQIQNTQSLFESINILQTLASQSPLGEITLNLVPVSSGTPETITVRGSV